jgi:glycosyltransferase involved in cell wall biosynthesis
MRRKKRPVRRLKKTDLHENARKKVARYNQGLNEGYQQGVQAGYGCYDSCFEGTSIIIPSFNEVEWVKNCIEGIMDHTDSAYEIIVIDNGSSDGIEHYLKQMDGQVRYRILSQNAGFTGAANRGFMMAKGTTILLLSSHICPTENWLENMLICLNSDRDIGMVGPVSNALNGNQHMDMHYDDMDEMHELASMNNESSPQVWQRTDRLSAKCLLFRRVLLEQIGYLDEGCQEAPFEEEDYCLRVRLQGYSLVCAKDAYVHMPLIEEAIWHNDLKEAAIKASKLYYMNKWSNPDHVLFDPAIRLTNRPESVGVYEKRLGISVFFPQEIAVKGLGQLIYWIADGVRRPIIGEWDQPVIQLSQIDLWRWDIGESISAEEAAIRNNVRHERGLDSIQNGAITKKPDGSFYYIENGMKREIIGMLAAEAWGLSARPPIILSAAELAALPEGLPVIAPVHLRQAL